MLTPKLTSCNTCSEIPVLLAAIDLKVAEQALLLYQNMLYLLNRPLEDCLIENLLHYRRILTFKYMNEDYAKCFTVEQIANKIRTKTLGMNKDCDCSVSMFTTTTSSTTIL